MREILCSRGFPCASERSREQPRVRVRVFVPAACARSSSQCSGTSRYRHKHRRIQGRSGAQLVEAVVAITVTLVLSLSMQDGLACASAPASPPSPVNKYSVHVHDRASGTLPSPHRSPNLRRKFDLLMQRVFSGKLSTSHSDPLQLASVSSSHPSSLRRLLGVPVPIPVNKYQSDTSTRTGELADAYDEDEDENAYNHAVRQRQRQRQQNRKQSPWSIVTNAATALLQDPARLGRYTATCCQIGLATYLLYELWKAASEIADELNNSDATASSDSAESQPLVKQTQHQQVQQVLQFLEQDLDAVLLAPTTSTPSDTDSSQRKFIKALTKSAPTPLVPMSIPPQPILLQLAQKLMTAGLPLRSEPRDDGAPLLPSVESLLLELTRSEANLLQQCLWTPPSAATDNLDSVWNSVAGLDSVKDRLMGTLASLEHLSRLQHGHGSSSSSLQHNDAYSSLFASTGTPTSDGASSSAAASMTTGVLLYGPPGCGKTLLVRALASKARLPCLVIAPSVLLRKYVGETSLQVRSLFSLATKLAPCILCIDELDGLFRERSDDEHQVSRDLKTEFLQWLDGMMMATTNSAAQQQHQRRHPILVVGATNRPFDVDSAVLRRLPQSHFVGLPDESDRCALLTQLLKSVPTAPDLDIDEIARQTDGYSPSDLRQVLQTAALSGPMRHPGTRGLTTEDIATALQAIPPTPLTDQYRMQLSRFARLSLRAPLSPPSSASSSSMTVMDNGASKWETSIGNFYNVGTLVVDSHTFDLLNEIAKNIEMDDNTDEFDGANSEDDGL